MFGWLGLPVRGHHQQCEHLPGPLRPRRLLLRHTGPPAPLQSCSQVLHHQIYHFPLLLAGTLPVPIRAYSKNF